MVRLSNEQAYLEKAKNESEKELRLVWIKQIEKEIASEVEFLKSKGISVYVTRENTLSDDDLLNELFD
jgi:hypothetical protein